VNFRWQVFILLNLFMTPHAFGQLSWSKFLNPGPLASPHSTLEGGNKCESCHELASGVPNEKCLACHQEIATQVRAKSGWHSKQTLPCFKCHSDHKGKTYDLMGLTRKLFSHNDTKLPLSGMHAKIKCEKCHDELRVNSASKKKGTSNTYLGLKSYCVSCHRDVHDSRKGSFRVCQKCHSEDNWKNLKNDLGFNHNKESRFALIGAHRRVDCYDCHKNKTWSPLKFSNCTDCHKDPHKNKFGSDCLKCHNMNSWKQGGGSTSSGGGKVGFNHNKTAFPLKGEHVSVACETCHGSKIGKIARFKECSDCHNNPHGSQFRQLWDQSKTCKDCHIEDGWNLLKFQHNTNSRYKLDGGHSIVPCKQCHVDTKYRWLSGSPDCNTCHLDVHKSQFVRTCASCHITDSFEKLTFDHNKEARFPLVGKHQKVQCAWCHDAGKYKDLDTRCSACHNDFHANSLGIECPRCHAPIAFNDIDFEHNIGSRFKLTGKHIQVPCTRCHVRFEYKIKDATCVRCHLDVHQPSKGKNCEKCHTTDTFFSQTK